MQKFHALLSHTFASIDHFYVQLVLAAWHPVRIARRVLASALKLNISPQIALSAVAAATTLLHFLQYAPGRIES